MKIIDLMIGDLLIFRDCQQDSAPVIFEIKEIHESELVVQFNGEQGYDIIDLTDEVVGIPLTSDILERNGFTLEEVGDNGVLTGNGFRNRYEKWRLHTEWRDTFVEFDRINDYWRMRDIYVSFRYTHELQQRLRMCKIDKTIIL